MNYYVYIYLDSRKPGIYKYGEYEFDYEPFYIGKGKEKRIIDKYNRNKYFNNLIGKIDPVIRKFKENLSENESLNLECDLIKIIGRKDLNNGPLVNLTNGGEGASGRKWTEITYKKQKKNFEEIKNYFKNKGYNLISKENEYKNNKQKLRLICPYGHMCLIRWNDFYSGHGCVKCQYKKLSKKYRKKFNDIKKEFEINNYILIINEEEYLNAHQKLKCKCQKCENINNISYGRIKQKQYINCKFCGGL
jgi:hypothetical protein